MSLFSHKKQTKKDGAAKAAPASLTDYSGMQVDVLDAEDRLLFTARLSVSANGDARLWQISDGFVPPFEPPKPVKLRGYQPTEHSAVHFEGGMARAGDGFWTLEGLKLTGKENDRAFYREATSIRGDLRHIGWIGAETKPCEIINISAGGVRIRCTEEYQAGEKLLLIAPLRKGAEASTLLCEIRRADGKKGVAYEYGCRFVNLTEATEDQIAEAIMELQRQKLKR